MAYTRKTKDEYQIHVRYGHLGYEEVCSEDTYKEAKERLKEYRKNEPQYPSMIVVKRVRI